MLAPVTPRRRRRFRAGARRPLPLPVLLVALAAMSPAAGCRPSPAADGHQADLLAPANAPTLLQERSVTGVGDTLFLDGWSVIKRAPRRAPKRWLGDEPGSLVIDLADPEPRRRLLLLELRAVELAAGELVRVEALFDGERLGELDCRPRWEWRQLEIPARLAGPGRHLLELRPQGARALAGRRGRDRRLSVALRELRLEPGPATDRPPRLASGALHLPPGTAAAWAFWVPAGGRLIARWEGGAPRHPTPFLVATEGSPPRALGPENLGALAGHCVQLLALAPSTADTGLILAGLRLAEPTLSRRPTSAAARSLLVVGELSDGFPVTPSSTAPDRAQAALLSGHEAAATGWSLPAAFDFVGHDPAAVAGFLEAAKPPVAAALVLPGEPARPAATELARRFPDLFVLMAELPAASDDFAPLAATLAPWQAPENARDIDLTATTLAAAGRQLVGLGGVDLRPVLAGQAPARVRPVAPVWLADRSIAIAGDRRSELALGDPRPARSVTEACALDYLRRRRRSLVWIDR